MIDVKGVPSKDKCSNRRFIRKLLLNIFKNREKIKFYN